MKQPRRGGTLTVGQSGGGIAFDPHIDSTSSARFESCIYEGLVNQNKFTLDIHPELAQKWEQPSSTEYVFTLRPGVKFHDKPPASGRELTVNDVVFSLQRVQTNNPRFTSRSLLDGVKFEAVDRSTIKVTTREPESSFMAKIAGDATVIAAQDVLEKAGAAVEPGKLTQPDVVVGTGAFILKTVVENVSTELVRNPNYWDPKLPYVDEFRRLKLYLTQGNDQAWAALIAGQVDVIALPGSRVKEYLARRGSSFNPEWAKDPTPYQVTPNTKVKPFDDARVTRALRLLVDHDEALTAWMEVWAGRGRLVSFLPANLDSWELAPEEYSKYLEWQKPKDGAVREALTLLSAAGFTKDHPLSFEMTTAGSHYDFVRAGGELLHGQYLRLGQGVVQPKMKLTPDNTTYQTLRANRDYAFAFFSNAASFDDPDAWFSQLYHSQAGRNYWNYEDPKLDAQIARQRTIFDANERKAYVKEMLVYMIENHPGVFLAGSYVLNGLNPKLQGFTPEFVFEGRQYKNVWFDA